MITKSTKEEEIQKLFDKANDLTDNQKLSTSFGNDKYTIIKNEDGCFLYRVLGGYTSCKPRIYNFKTVQELMQLIFSDAGLQMYAVNAYTKQVQFYDNWIDFVKAFKLIES